MHLKERLSRSTKGSKSISEYLHDIKVLSNKLVIMNFPLDGVDLGHHQFYECPWYSTAALRTRENPIGFDDLLSEFEIYLKRDDTLQETPLIATVNAAQRET
jgi:hypothetical protein